MKRSGIARWGIVPVVAIVIVGGLSALAGCAGDNDATPRSVVQIARINDNLPLQSDLYNRGSDLEKPDDDFIPIDYVPVVFTSRPSDDALTMEPDKPFGTVHFYRYTLTWDKTDLNSDGYPDLHNIDGPMNAIVPINNEGAGAVLAVPAGWKTDPQGYLHHIYLNFGEAMTTAHFVFYGEEETSHAKFQLEAGMLVSFADYVDKR